jgi:hypothetical protein
MKNIQRKAKNPLFVEDRPSMHRITKQHANVKTPIANHGHLRKLLFIQPILEANQDEASQGLALHVLFGRMADNPCISFELPETLT